MTKTDKNSYFHGAYAKGHLEAKSHLYSKLKAILKRKKKKVEAEARE